MCRTISWVGSYNFLEPTSGGGGRDFRKYNVLFSELSELRGAGRWFLLPFGESQASFPLVFSLYAKLN